MKTLTSKEWNRIKLTVSAVAIGIFLLHLLRPDLSIDTTALILLAIAFLPWLTPILQKIEFPGGIKVELKELEELRDDAKDAGLLLKRKKQAKKSYTFETVTLVDPNLALAGLRIEIERILRKLADDNEIGDASAVLLLRYLVRENALSVEEGVVLSDLLIVLNKAVHGAKVDEEASSWALTTGIQILEALEAKL
jgi:hypothetical protein